MSLCCATKKDGNGSAPSSSLLKNFLDQLRVRNIDYVPYRFGLAVGGGGTAGSAGRLIFTVLSSSDCESR